MTDLPHRNEPLQTSRNERDEQIWDPALRWFHWLLAVAVTGGWLLGHFGPLQMTGHFMAGYAVAALLCFRFAWGFAGPRNARFASFVRGPRAVLAYARGLASRTASHATGHNPLRGWSVVAMLLVLAAQVGTGLIIDPEDYINIGPLASAVSPEWNRWALGMHHRLAFLLMILVVLHVGAIAFYYVWKRENLVWPMITGRRRK